MRFLISLSLKYLRRQKLRSTLTFLCITLSVFILNAFGVALSSLLATLRANEIRQNGAWEVNVQSIMNAVAMRDGKTEQEVGAYIADLAVVSDYLYCNDMWLELCPVRNTEGGMGYLEIQIDDKQPHRFQEMRMNQSGGNPTLLGSRSYYDSTSLRGLQENEAILPIWVQEMGYQVGDTVTLTCTPVYAILSDDIPQVQAARKLLEEKNNSDEGKFYVVSDDPEVPKYDASQYQDVYHQHLLKYVKENYTLDEIEFHDTQRGEPSSVTVTIAGFATGSTLESGQFDLSLEWGLGNFTEAIYMPNTAMNVQWDELRSPTAQVTGSFMDYYGNNERLIRIADHVQFEDGLVELLKALDAEDPELYSYHFPNSLLHGMLLALELKSFDASNDFVLGCGLAAILLIIIWAFARFVIDNAFEISVQERSMQFASLRVMGASKRQLTALVFTEATAYALTAVPIGALTAVGLCKLLVTIMRNAGIQVFTLSVNPWLLLTLVLALAAIYISAYTSAIYASRKMTLTEAMQFGKPRTSKRRSASRLKLSGKAFLYRYAWKNIMRTKRRFFISSVAMVLGVTLTTACLFPVVMLGVIAVVNDVNSSEMDFRFYGGSISDYNALVEYFDGNENYSSYTVRGGAAGYFVDDESQTLLDAMLQSEAPVEILSIQIVHESIYTKYMEPLTGISYADWRDSKKAFIIEDCYPYGKYDEKRKPLDPLPAVYTPISQITDKETPVISYTMNDNDANNIPLLGYVCPLPESVGKGLDVYGAAMVLPVENFYLFGKEQIWMDGNATASSKVRYETIIADMQPLLESGTIWMDDEYMYGTGAKRTMAALFIAVFCFVGSIWLSGVLSMVNSLHTGVLNRRSELRMLRAVGCSIKQMRKMLIMEGVLFSSVSTVIGLLLGAWFSANFSGILDEFGVVGMGIILLIIAAAMFGINQLIAALCSMPGIKELKHEVR